MGTVYTLGVVVPGGKVAISSDRTLLCISQFDKDEYLNAISREAVDEPRPKPKLEPFLEVPDTADRPCFMITGDMPFEGDFTKRTVSLIKKGATYSTTLFDDATIDLGDEVAILRCEFLVVLEETDAGALLLGVLHADTEDGPREGRLVAMMDLLGFSHILETQDLDEIERKYESLIPPALATAGLASSGALVFTDDGGIDLSDDLLPVTHAVFSDTVILHPRDERTTLTALCQATLLTIDMALMAGWLFRAGLAYGSFKANSEQRLFLGTSVVRAHQVEAAQEWCGCVLDDSVESEYSEEISELMSRGMLVRYPAPLKKGADQSHKQKDRLVLNWCFYDFRAHGERITKLESLLSAAPPAGRVKIANTISFARLMEERGLADAEALSLRGIGDPTGFDGGH